MNHTLPNHDESYQDLLGYGIARRLNDSADDLPHDISQRLKAARAQALGRRKVVKTQFAAGAGSNGSTAVLHMDEDDRSVWNRFASLLPLLALIAGLITIGVFQEQNRAQEVAEVDAEILTDDLPPAAFTDPGFLRFLSAKQQD